MIKKVPTATCRLSFGPDFRFRDAANILDYLTELGIDTIYASPIMKSDSRFLHGYHVIDPGKIDEKIGTREELIEIGKALEQRNMGWIQDFIPNHLSFDGSNPYLFDVLKFGSGSRSSPMFDIDWDHHILKDRVLAPILGRPLDQCLADGEIEIRVDSKGPLIKYFNRILPLSNESYLKILSEAKREFEDIIIKEAITNLEKMISDPGINFNKDLHSRFVSKYTKWIQDKVLPYALGMQNYQLSYWKMALNEINYRRFFTINDLICLDIENDRAFHRVHDTIVDLVKEGIFSGLRVDHIDGIRAPLKYLRRLRSETGGDIYIVAEKILSEGEKLPEWPVEGTTGYDFMRVLGGLFFNKEGSSDLDRLDMEMGGEKPDRLIIESKKKILKNEMAPDLKNLARLAKKRSMNNHMVGFEEALLEFMAALDVYRTYPGEDRNEDDGIISSAVEKASESEPLISKEIKSIGRLVREDDDFASRLMQFTGPIMAKGFEDTFFYRYNRSIGFNEVGGNPVKPGIDIEEFHRFNEERLKNIPLTMNSTSTHDSKWGEDVRSRLAVLTDMSGQWRSKVLSWHRMNMDRKVTVDFEQVPDSSEEHRIYQILVGAMPWLLEERDSFYKRLMEHVVKWLREAKIHSSWIDPDEDYENNVQVFVDEILKNRSFRADLHEFTERVRLFGMYNSLTQTVLRITCPGIPDLYRGSETWNLSMVDPDNRGPVDFQGLSRSLEMMKDREIPDLIKEILDNPEDGRIKLFITWKALNARMIEPDLFRKGEYIPLKTRGKRSENLLSFARRKGSGLAVIAVPLHLASFMDTGKEKAEDVWEDTEILLPEESPGCLVDQFTGRTLFCSDRMKASDVFSILPVGLLTGGD